MTDNTVKFLLIIDDDKDMQEMYRIYFSGQDRYAIDIESNAEIGLKKITQKKYDLIILDIVMEPMSGDAFFFCVRSRKKTATLPILVVSVLNRYTLEPLKKINHVSFLQKPITKEQLMEKIKDRIG